MSTTAIKPKPKPRARRAAPNAAAETEAPQFSVARVEQPPPTSVAATSVPQPLPVVGVPPAPKPAPKPRTSPKAPTAQLSHEAIDIPHRFIDAPVDYNEWTAALRGQKPPPRASPSAPELWMAAFQRYLAVLLSPIFKDRETVNLAIGAPYVNIFRRAFTHVSFSADDYDPLETIGDRILDTTFVRYVRSRIPKATARLLTNFKVSYTSKTYQSALATEMAMDRFVLLGAASAESREDTTTASVREDVLEAFIAALDQVATAMHQKSVAEGRFEEAVLRRPPGPEAVRMFVDFVFDAKGLDPKMAEDAAKSTLSEIGTIFGIRSRAIIFDSTPGAGGSHSVRATDTLIRVLAENGIANFPIVLASGYPDKTAAAEAALARAEEFGVTRDWIAEKREISRSLNSLPADTRERVAAKARSQGLAKVFTEIPESTRQADGSFTLVLIGSDAGDNRRVLADAVASNMRDGRMAVANNFLAL